MYATGRSHFEIIETIRKTQLKTIYNMRWKKHFDIIETTKRAQLIETTLKIVRKTYIETIKTIEMTKRSKFKIAKTKWKTKFETIDIR